MIGWNFTAARERRRSSCPRFLPLPEYSYTVGPTARDYACSLALAARVERRQVWISFQRAFDQIGEFPMYANILLSTDGSDVARKGIEHGIALAKALNSKVTVVTVTEPLPID